MKIIGLDYSLTAFGVTELSVGPTSAVRMHCSVFEPKVKGLRRLDQLVELVEESTDGAYVVVYESPAWGAQGNTYHQTAGGWWIVRHTLHRLGALVVEVNPTQVKQYALGKGSGKGTGKDAVISAVVRRYPQFTADDNNAADSLVLAAMAARRSGHPIESDLPLTHLRALDAVTWPTQLALPLETPTQEGLPLL
jgi:Holliday junction resolvasome RuvABC endonuclease subunit